MAHWTTYTLTDGGTLTVSYPSEQYIRAMREFRVTGTIDGLLFSEPEPGQNPDPEHAWEWGPGADDVDWAGCPGDLLAAGDIAALAGTTANTVHQWAKRYADFRALAHETSAGLIWHESDVLDWLRRTGRLR